MSNQSFDYLMERYLNDTLSAEEAEMLHELLKLHELPPAGWDYLLKQSFLQVDTISPAQESDKYKVLHLMRQRWQTDRLEAPVRPLRRLPVQLAAAAAILVFILAGWYFLKPNHNNNNHPVAEVSDKAPGGNHATLQLGDGSTIVLDDKGIGVVAVQGGISPIKRDSNLLVYSGEAANMPVSNTLLTPRGGQFKLVLPDGTRVWLNAASALTYPSSFTGSSREVQLSGEAYFEVATDAKHPFIVRANDMELKVLGTSFNMMAYPDEPSARTTLTQGAVKLTKGTATATLQPGMVAGMDAGGKAFTIEPANEAHELAWKNGLFSFHKADIRSIMRQLSRWYQVDIKYAGTVPAANLVGDISRTAPLSKVLKLLQLSGIHCTLNGNTVTVSPQ